MRSLTTGRVIASALLALPGLFLAWQFASSAFRWSNGWMEGLSYALGAVAFPPMAALLVSGRVRHPAMYGCAAVLAAVPGAWCIRWTVWLLTRAPEIGPCPAYVPLAFALVGALLLSTAGMLAERACRRGR